MKEKYTQPKELVLQARQLNSSQVPDLNFFFFFFCQRELMRQDEIDFQTRYNFYFEKRTFFTRFSIGYSRGGRGPILTRERNGNASKKAKTI